MALTLVAGAAGVVPAGAEDEPEETVPLSVPGMPVSLAQAGQLGAIDPDTGEQIGLWGKQASSVPAWLTDVAVTQVVFPQQAGLALTADGRVIGWGDNEFRLQDVPSDVAAADVAQIDVTGQYAGAVTRSGRVMTWGNNRPFETPRDVPAGLSGVKQLALTEYAAAALKDDGSVVVWGSRTNGEQFGDAPEGLRATQIVASGDTLLALTEEGTVVAWGNQIPYGGLPGSLLEPGNVKAIASGGNGAALALLADNSLVQIGTLYGVPAEVEAVEPVLLANSTGSAQFAVVDRNRTIHYWDPSGDPSEVPEELNGRDLAQITMGPDDRRDAGGSKAGGVIITKMLRVERPRVRGTARVGSTLTGTPGTFSADPEAVTSQWLANGVPIAGAANSTLRVTRALAGKRIAYRSTATKGEESATSQSSATARVPKPAPVKVKSRTKIKKVKKARKARRVKVIAKVRAARSPKGKAKMVIKKGKKTIVKKKVRVNRKGKIKAVIKKFRKRVLRKARNWRGKYKVKIKYLGNKRVKPSKAKKKFRIRR